MRILNAQELKILVPVRPLFLQRRIAEAALDPRGHAAFIQARLHHVVQIFIAGDRDLLIPSVKEAYAMAARMPNARVKVIKGAGHACLLGSRVRLDELLAGWDETFL